MKAITYAKYGPPEVLEMVEVEKPAPQDKEILVRVHATTVNRTDCGFRKPEPFFVRIFNGLIRPRIKILGNEFAGVVAEAGKEVKAFRTGDAVFGLTGGSFGAHAEYLCVPETGAVAKKPENMDFEEASAVCDGFMLAMNYLGKIDLKGRKKILIYGASGSIGTAGVQLAKFLGAEVTAVCNTKNVDIVRSLGADYVIDFLKEDFTKNGETYDFIFDAVGKHSYFRCKDSLNPEGAYLVTDLGRLCQNPFLAVLTSMRKGKKVMFPLPKETKEIVLMAKELIEAGAYRAVIDRRWPLDQIVEATKYVETEQKTGSVVITMPAAGGSKPPFENQLNSGKP
jgi:NADPH:quinone reductase-like Zn-dependent oxidoreductase